MMNEAVHKVLDDLQAYHPSYDANEGYEMAGFVWFQGFNDQFSPAFRDNYRSNMISLIKDVRAEYKVPNMPFVIGVLGTGVTAEKVTGNAVSVGQREAAKRPNSRTMWQQSKATPSIPTTRTRSSRRDGRSTFTSGIRLAATDRTTIWEAGHSLSDSETRLQTRWLS